MKLGDSGSNRIRMDLRDLSSYRIDKLVEDWLPTNQQLQTAINISVTKTAKWARTLAAKNIKADTGLPAVAVKRRVLLFRLGHTQRIYFGLNPIPVASLGAKQNKKGVRAKGGVDIPSAFIVDMVDYDAVFKRKSGTRYPLEFQRVYFEDEARRVIQADIEPYIQGRFFKILEHELKWQMNK